MTFKFFQACHAFRYWSSDQSLSIQWLESMNNSMWGLCCQGSSGLYIYKTKPLNLNSNPHMDSGIWSNVIIMYFVYIDVFQCLLKCILAPYHSFTLVHVRMVCCITWHAVLFPTNMTKICTHTPPKLICYNFPSNSFCPLLQCIYDDKWCKLLYYWEVIDIHSIPIHTPSYFLESFQC